ITGRTKQLSLKTTPEFHKELKMLATQEECLMIEIIERAFADYQKKLAKKSAKENILPKVSPIVTPTKSSKRSRDDDELEEEKNPRLDLEKKTNGGNLFYWLKLLVEAKEEVANHKKAIKDIKERLSLFVSFPSKYKIIGLAFSGDIKKKEHEITTFIIKKGNIEQVNYPRLIREEEYLNLFFSLPLPADFQEVKKIADKVNEELYSVQLQPSRRIALVAGFLLVLSPHQTPTEEETINKNVANVASKNLTISLLDNFIKNNFAGDLKRILSSSLFEKNNKIKEKRLETIIRIIENIVQATNFQNNTTLAIIAQEIAKITTLFSRQYDIGAEFYRTFLKY
ncbi:6118_t:CDS:2, partial [Funneliformis geosporum]